MPKTGGSVYHEIARLRRSLRTVEQSLRRLGPLLRKAVKEKWKARPDRVARRLNLSPKRIAQLKLQGRYMGYLRALTPRQKAEVKKLRGRRGMLAAVASARRMMGRRKAA
jgi:hypothetical protein